jgi:hypothetical protein
MISQCYIPNAKTRTKLIRTFAFYSEEVQEILSSFIGCSRYHDNQDNISYC